jgi:hypothetical protein
MISWPRHGHGYLGLDCILYGTATISGTRRKPPGQYSIALMATNVAGSVTQRCVLVVDPAPG